MIEKDSCKTLVTTKISFEDGNLQSKVIQKKIFKGDPNLHFLILSRNLIHILKFSDPDSDDEGPLRAQFYDTYRFNLETAEIFKVTGKQSDINFPSISHFPENHKFSYEYHESKIFKITHTALRVDHLPNFEQNLFSVKDVFPKKKDEIVQSDHFYKIHKKIIFKTFGEEGLEIYENNDIAKISLEEANISRSLKIKRVQVWGDNIAIWVILIQENFEFQIDGCLEFGKMFFWKFEHDCNFELLFRHKLDYIYSTFHYEKNEIETDFLKRLKLDYCELTETATESDENSRIFTVNYHRFSYI